MKLSLDTVIDLACVATGCAREEVFFAEYRSPLSLAAVERERPGILASCKRSDPHWRIRLRGKECVDGDGFHITELKPDHDVLVFEDGEVMPHHEAIKDEL